MYSLLGFVVLSSSVKPVAAAVQIKILCCPASFEIYMEELSTVFFESMDKTDQKYEKLLMLVLNGLR